MPLEFLARVDLPVIQAPMAGSQDSALAIAVCNGGGLGSLACAPLGIEAMRAELDVLAARTRGAYNLNFFCHAAATPDPAREQAWRSLLQPYYREFGLEMEAQTAPASRRPFDAAMCDLLEQFRPPVVSFHFGLPSSALLQRIRAWGGKLVSSATTVEEARWLEARGVDAVIAQGIEAGGHRGHFLSADLSLQSGTLPLLRRIVRAVEVPVIAAGGIADREGVAAALALGASAVQVGTTYLLCPEATTTAVHRAALQSDASTHTALTNLFSGRPARGIVNRLMRELGPVNAKAPGFPLAATALAPLRAHCEGRGNGDFSPLWAGQDTGQCRPIAAAEMTRRLAGTG